MDELTVSRNVTARLIIMIREAHVTSGDANARGKKLLISSEGERMNFSSDRIPRLLLPFAS